MTTNGQPEQQLPDTYEAAVKSAMVQMHSVSAERDELKTQVWQLKSDLAAHKVALEAMSVQFLQIESRVASAYAVRDQAVAEAEKNKAINASALAVLRAGEVQNQPLIREIPEEEVPTIGGA